MNRVDQRASSLANRARKQFSRSVWEKEPTCHWAKTLTLSCGADVALPVAARLRHAAGRSNRLLEVRLRIVTLGAKAPVLDRYGDRRRGHFVPRLCSFERCQAPRPSTPNGHARGGG